MANSGDLGLKGILKRNVGCGCFLVLFRDFFFLLEMARDLVMERVIGVCEAIACSECHIQTMFVNLSKE